MPRSSHWRREASGAFHLLQHELNRLLEEYLQPRYGRAGARLPPTSSPRPGARRSTSTRRLRSRSWSSKYPDVDPASIDLAAHRQSCLPYAASRRPAACRNPTSRSGNGDSAHSIASSRFRARSTSRRHGPRRIRASSRSDCQDALPPSPVPSRSDQAEKEERRKAIRSATSVPIHANAGATKAASRCGRAVVRADNTPSDSSDRQIVVNWS